MIFLFIADGKGAEESAALMCALCKENFSSPWDLMVHAQAAHMVNIYQLSTKDSTPASQVRTCNLVEETIT